MRHDNWELSLPNQNERPSNYVGPTTQCGKFLVAKMLRHLLPTLSLTIVGERPSESHDTDPLQFVLHPPTLLQTIYMLIFPDFWVGAHYARGNWYLSRGDLAEFMRQLMLEALTSYMRYLWFVSKIRGPYFGLRRYLLDPLESRQVSTHYDLDADLYASFLDEEMIYTCAFFENGIESLEEAQELKKNLVAQRLQIHSGEFNLLDVGSGWGGFERFFTRKFQNVRVTGLTLAKNQIRWSEEKNEKDLTANQFKRISYECEHFQTFRKDQSELFDGIIAVGMIEHVGLKHYDEFVQNAKRLLRQNGRCLVHTIISPKGAMPSNKWMDIFIFPGGYTPSLSELVKVFEVEGLVIEGVFLHEGRNYFLTLESWRKRFLANWLNRPLDRDQTAFGRMWHFYLSVARNMFDPHLLGHQVAHIVIKKL